MRGWKKNKAPTRFVWVWGQWCDKVTEQVRFRPDREAIRQELLAHLEDSAADWERRGETPKEAEQRALAAMGDPVAVGKALDRAHKPWLGWLWRLSQWMLLGMTAVALMAVFSGNQWEIFWSNLQGQLAWTDPPVTAHYAAAPHTDLWLAPEAVTEEEGLIHARAKLWIEMDGPAMQPGWLYDLSVTTDQGEVALRERRADGTWPESGYYSWSESGSAGWTRYTYELELVLTERPAWVELRYPAGGGDWVLRAEWRDGA